MQAAKHFSTFIDGEAQGDAWIWHGAHGVRSGPTTNRRTLATTLSLCVGGARFVVESGNQLMDFKGPTVLVSAAVTGQMDGRERHLASAAPANPVIFPMDSELRFFARRAHIRITRHHLPPWQQPGATYFVTFRLADSLPGTLLDGWRNEREAWLRRHPIPHTPELDFEYHRLFATRIEDWLDAGHGSCLLRTPAFREIVAGALAYFEDVRYRQLAWVIMPTHVHVCFALHPGWPLEKVIFSWKRQSARAINQVRGATGSLWQHDYFDRLVRDAAHLGRVIRYVRGNPIKAVLAPGQFTLWESDDSCKF